MKKGSNNNISDLISKLISSYEKTQESTKIIESIASKSKMLSINSAIESARIGIAGRGFAVIAKQIESFSLASEKANRENQRNISDLNEGISEVVGVRTADVAYDLIDKIDRNLFERNCDVQAWATFEAIVDFCGNTDSQELQQKVVDLLHNLFQIYEVYYDIFMTDVNGTIVAAANHREHMGKSVQNEEWFKESIKREGCFVTDMHYSNLVDAFAVSYSCGIKDANGKAIGVLSTRFNWDFIYEILSHAKISHAGDVYVANKDGVILASREKSDVFKVNIKDLYPETNDVIKGEKYSYFIKFNEKNLLTSVIGCKHNRGYNNYSGKDWSVIVREVI